MLSKIGGNEGFDELNQRFKDIDTEENKWKAWGQAFEEWEQPWGMKFLYEVAL